jgi:hypothetical protein
MAADGIECSASDIGKVICTDGSIYAKVSDVPTGKTAVAMIAYIDMENKNGLALALSDEGSMTWGAAKTACEGKSAVAGGTWVLPSKEQWEAMGAVDSEAAAATALRDGFSSVGGTNMQSGAYWSSTANSTDANKAYRYYFTTGFYWENNVNKTENSYVRACLTFNILVAPPTYKITMAEGTEDASNWQGKAGEGEFQTLPLEGVAEGATVTVTYNGEKKVKSVKAVKKAAAPSVPDGALSGKFSVSATKKVNFSKGNLYYNANATTKWYFADNQWDYVSTATSYPMDHFTWGNIDNPTYNGTAFVEGAANLSGNTDWGSRMGSGWYTLSSAEWVYLFNTRTVNGGTGSGKSYTLGQNVNGVLGVVLYPDDYTGSTYTTGSDWSDFESAGCVFLPAAGNRYETDVLSVGEYGGYWSSTAYETDKAYGVYFYSDEVAPAYSTFRDYGFSVRLVRPIE